MARGIDEVAAGLSLDQLRGLLKIKEKMAVLEGRRDKLARELADVDGQLDAMRTEIAKLGSGRGIARRKPRAVAAKKRTRRAAAPAATKSSGKSTLEDVVITVLRNNGAPMRFPEILDAIQSGKLYKSKSKDFQNVLRRTLSTAKSVKRLTRGVYGLAGMKAPRKPVAKKAAPAKAVKKAAKKAGRKKVAKAKKAAGRVTLADVVADLLKKKGEPMSFKDIKGAIVSGKLYSSKSKNFENVLRRTLSIGKAFAREGRGIYKLKKG